MIGRGTIFYPERKGQKSGKIDAGVARAGQYVPMNVTDGTLTVQERVKIGQMEQARDSYFVFDPKNLVVMRSPSKEPVEFMLMPADIVKVDSVAFDGKQQSRSITMYAPVVTSTTRTTTVTTMR